MLRSLSIVSLITVADVECLGRLYEERGGGRHAKFFSNRTEFGVGVNVFGGTRRNVESANVNIRAAAADMQAVRLLLISEVATDYFLLRSAQNQIAIAEENLKAQQHTSRLTHQRVSAGLASSLGSANADVQVATTSSVIPVLDTTVRQSIYAISVLLAKNPGDLLGQLSNEGSRRRSRREFRRECLPPCYGGDRTFGQRKSGCMRRQRKSE